MSTDNATLGQFIQEALVALESNDPLTTEGIIIKTKHLFPDVFIELSGQQILNHLNNPQALKKELLRFFHELNERPPHIKDEIKQDSSVSPQEIAERTRLYKKAAQKASLTIDQEGQTIQELRATYARRVAENYIKQSKKYWLSQKKEQIKDASIDIPERISSNQEMERCIQRVVQTIPDFPQKEQVFARVVEEAREDYDRYNLAQRTQERAQQVFVEAQKSFLVQPNPTIKPDVFFEKAIRLATDSSLPSIPIKKAVELASKEARFAEVANGVDVSRVRLEDIGLSLQTAQKKFDSAMKAVVNSPQFLQLSHSGGTTQKQSAGGFFGSLFSSATSILDSTKAPPNEDMILYLEALYEKQRISGGDVKPNPHEYAVSSHYANHPTLFHFEPGASPFNWVLRFGAKKGSEEVIAGAVAKTGLGAWSKEAITGLGVKFLTRIGAPAWLVGLGGGPVGWVIFGVTVVLPYVWNYLGKALGGFKTGAISFAQASTRAVAGYVASIPGLKPYEEKSSTPMLIGGLVAAVFLLPILATFSTMSVRREALSTEAGGASGLGAGPDIIGYSGPNPSGPLQCLNYNVSSKQFGDVAARQFSPAQGATVNQAINAYPQLGLYNCLLSCPQNKINLYSGGSSPWWGWTVNNQDVVIYNGFFAPGASDHLRARLIAHELAHELARAHPEIKSAFLNGTTGQPRGYCRCLGTYPSGTKLPGGDCSPFETPDETFAESAAMFLTGENLESLCAPGYNFMSSVFNNCAVK